MVTEAVLVPGGSPHGPGDPASWKWCNLWGTPNFFHLGKNCGEAEFPVECAMYGYDTIAAWATFLDPQKTEDVSSFTTQRYSSEFLQPKQCRHPLSLTSRREASR